MNEEEMVKRCQAALGEAGVDDTVIAASVFLPRGWFGGSIAGGMIGGSIIDDGIGTVGGAIAGRKAVVANASVPERCMVAVSKTHVYGFDTEHEYGRVPTKLVFTLDRTALEAKVHQRFNVRVLELIDKSGATVVLEGPRLPGFHDGSVIHELQG